MTAGLVTAMMLTSAAAILVLALRDPKRLRNVSRSGALAVAPLSRNARRWLSVFSLIPGGVLIALSHWSGFLIWFGAVSALGWGISNALSPQPKRDRPSSTRNIHAQ